MKSLFELKKNNTFSLWLSAMNFRHAHRHAHILCRLSNLYKWWPLNVMCRCMMHIDFFLKCVVLTLPPSVSAAGSFFMSKFLRRCLALWPLKSPALFLFEFLRRDPLKVDQCFSFSPISSSLLPSSQFFDHGIIRQSFFLCFRGNVLQWHIDSLEPVTPILLFSSQCFDRSIPRPSFCLCITIVYWFTRVSFFVFVFFYINISAAVSPRFLSGSASHTMCTLIPFQPVSLSLLSFSQCPVLRK